MSENKCKCDLRTKLVGDGCRYCNPQHYIDHLHDALDARDWVGLTDEELSAIWGEFGLALMPVRKAIASEIEAKLREKNA